MLGKQNIVYVIQELPNFMACTSSLSTHSFNFDKKLNAALRHSSKRSDIEHQCLQIRTHISHKITKQDALQSSRAKSFDLRDITNVTKNG